MGEQQASRPPQHQERQPGRETEMHPPPQSWGRHYVGSGRLAGKVALITGGDSGIGRAVAIAFAKEGADVAFGYLEETEDAVRTCAAIEQEGRRCQAIAGDIAEESICRRLVERSVRTLGRLDILVNNAGEQHPRESILDISMEQLQRTFATNIFSMFYLVKAALPHLPAGGRIINTTSVTAYRGSPRLLDYSSTKGAIVSFTRSLSLALADKGILVNGIAPGPIWTSLIPSTFDEKKVQRFGSQVPLGRAGEPDEVAPCYVFLASDASSYMSGQVLHPNGGEVING
ncbi:MAG: SDR family oxidoreductase [Burkholderiales bacterium]|nr:SDR family oxidoreductase [Burkholderiales bacterium]